MSMRFAVVGAAVRLPGVPDLDRMRRDLDSGATHFDTVSAAQAAASGLPARDAEHENYVPIASVLPGAEDFDREFFGLTEAEARWTDPQQRLLLTLTHEALESTGLDLSGRRVGAYVTLSASSYLRGRIPRSERIGPARVDYRRLLGNDRDFAASRLAYRFGFTGPAITVQSACSSSLVAVHQACAGLAFGDADAAVVGAVSLKFPQSQGYIHEPGGVQSPTGTSRPFDAAADGTIRGSGGGVVIVRRLDDALADGDPVLAVIAGSAVNNDGSARMGYTAPSATGQAEVLSAALRRAGIGPDEVGYVEAHGTGTPLGDPIEFRALSQAYPASSDRAEPCYLGSAKANYGHLDVAAGMVGLLKAVLVLDAGRIFPQPGFTEVNPGVPLASSAFAISPAGVDRPGLRYAAVSSFGMGGTNAHVVLEHSPRETVPVNGPVEIVLSARSAEGLSAYRERLSVFVSGLADPSVADIAATLQRRTRHRDHVWSTRVDSAEELVQQLFSDDSAVGEPASAGKATARGNRIWLPPAPLDTTHYGLPLVVGEDSDSGIDHRIADHRTGNRADRTVRPVGRSAEIREYFLQLVTEELGGEIDERTDFFAAGGESMALVAIVGKMTDRFGFRADFDRLDGTTAVGEMIRVLAATAEPSAAAPLTFGPGAPLIHLYPPAGGTNYCYAALSRLLPDIGLAAFRAQRTPAGTVEEIAAACVEDLRRRGELEQAPILGGYSFGGNVAFEIARQLEESGELPPGRVVMIDSFAPEAFRGGDGSADRAAAQVEQELRAMMGGRAEGWDVDGAGARVLDVFGDTWLANSRALTRYRPSGSISTPITLLRAVRPLAADRARALGIDPSRTAAWDRYTTGGLRVVDVPGDHYSLFTDPAELSVTAAVFGYVLRGLRSGRISRREEVAAS